MSLYRPYTSEPVIEDYAPVAQLEPDSVENFSALLKENLTRFLGVPKLVQPSNDCRD